MIGSAWGTTARDRVWGPRDIGAAIALLTVTGAGIIARSLSTGPAVALTLALSFLAVASLWWLAMSSAGLRIPERLALGALVAVLAVFAIASLLVPEEVDIRADRDDALDLAAAELVGGRDPWAVSTQIHESHHPSPGAGGILMAAPFALILRDSAWQNIFWVALSGFLLLRVAGLGSTVAATGLVVASPIFLNEWVFQSDLFTLALKLAVAMLWGVWAMRRESRIAFVLSAVLLGVVLSDRFLFLALALLAAVAILRWIPLRRSLMWLALSGGVTVLLLVVPWLLAPGYRDQMILNVSKGSEAGASIPNAGIALGVIMVALAVALGLLVRDDADLLGAAALVTLVVVAWQVALYSLTAGTLVIDGSLAVAYTGFALALGIGYLVLRRATRGALPRDNGSAAAKASDPAVDGQG